MAEIIIETPDTVRQKYFLQKMLENETPMAFIGATGTGKSAIIYNWLSGLSDEKFVPNMINFSAQTTAMVAQDMIMSRLEKLVLKNLKTLLGKNWRKLKVWNENLLPASLFSSRHFPKLMANNTM